MSLYEQAVGSVPIRNG